MAYCRMDYIKIVGAKENNLKNISLEIPKNKFIVITGISGSGKSSLAFDVIAKEGQRRYFETFSNFSRLYMGKLDSPNVESIEGLSPVLCFDQKSAVTASGSTVGTVSDIYDMLRLMFARIGENPKKLKLNRSLFSFNSTDGACQTCKGIGEEEQISVAKLIADPDKSLREGAIATSLPNGYIMYSQVTIDVLDRVCNAHGFNVDIPWKNLSEEQKNVILFGSTKIKVPFGKHSLESRLKWTGITPKPREESFYRGLIPIMTEILNRDRNDNILKYTESVVCRSCAGKRLNSNALSVTIHDKNIVDLSEMSLSSLRQWLSNQLWTDVEKNVAESIVLKIDSQISYLEKLGLGHLTLNRQTATLSAGDIQRLRLTQQISAGLSNIIYIFDEPSAGLHRKYIESSIAIFKMLVEKQNTVIVVEHDETTIKSAEWIIDIGPEAGKNGGELVFNGKFDDFINDKNLENKSATYRSLTMQHNKKKKLENISNCFTLKSCCSHNLKKIDVDFAIGKLNVVCGVAGSGKKSLVKIELKNRVEEILNGKNCTASDCKFDKIIEVSNKPIGRTPRSNPATYIGLSDKLRDVFAMSEYAKMAKLGKSNFSFNTKGGRCESCMGAGKIQVGMHFLGNVDIVCPDCEGQRFNSEVLKVKYNGKNISDIMKMSVVEAICFFEGQKSILKYLKSLENVGLGYIKLGQSSTTLSGGEAQRIKLATELMQVDTGKTLYIVEEPSIGLHRCDIEKLMLVFDEITKKGNTIVCIDNDEDIISYADKKIELENGEIINVNG